jgi:hypothetical protein
MPVLQNHTNEKIFDNENLTRPTMPFLYLLSFMIFVEHHSYNVDKPISESLFLHEC